MSKMITEELVVYTQPGCVQCTATYRALDTKGIPYRVIDVTKNEAALEYVKNLGYSQAPVIIVNEQDHWSGFNPIEIDRIATHTKLTPNTK